MSGEFDTPGGRVYLLNYARIARSLSGEGLQALAKWISELQQTVRQLEAEVALPSLDFGTDKPRCPTECDDDCDTPCHEMHQIPRKRRHNVDHCPGTLGERLERLEA